MNSNQALEVGTVQILPQYLDDQELTQKTRSLAEEERRITLEFLQHLSEFSSRKLHLRRGYDSLFSYLTLELKFSSGSAHRRLQSMEALQAVPELKEALLEGKVSLTNAAKMQTHFEEKAKLQEAYTPSEKREIFEKIQDKSTREAEIIIEDLRLEMSGASGQPILPQEKEKVLAQGNIQITFTADSELLEMLEKLRNLTAHSNPNPSYLELFKKLAKIAIHETDPIERAKRSRKLKESAEEQKSEDFDFCSAQNVSPKKKRSRYMAKEEKYQIWVRDESSCQYVDPLTGRKCLSKFGVEIEHKTLFCFGGENTAENCELRCKRHNLLAAEDVFGDWFKQFW